MYNLPLIIHNDIEETRARAIAGVRPMDSLQQREASSGCLGRALHLGANPTLAEQCSLLGQSVPTICRDCLPPDALQLLLS
mmetsp:Transcript_292/g.973  ORF Transcript_292/g.973 Transcript_292/m.973 type:complete len:81 (-) Transcript_292:1313-1555(-)